MSNEKKRFEVTYRVRGSRALIVVGPFLSRIEAEVRADLLKQFRELTSVSVEVAQ